MIFRDHNGVPEHVNDLAQTHGFEHAWRIWEGSPGNGAGALLTEEELVERMFGDDDRLEIGVHAPGGDMNYEIALAAAIRATGIFVPEVEAPDFASVELESVPEDIVLPTQPTVLA